MANSSYSKVAAAAAHQVVAQPVWVKAMVFNRINQLHRDGIQVWCNQIVAPNLVNQAQISNMDLVPEEVFQAHHSECLFFIGFD